MTDIEVENEIQRLLQSEAVKLAKAEERIKNKRRQYMYCLRTYERKGKALLAAGVTEDNLEETLNAKSQTA